MTGILRDVRSAGRTMRRHPGFTAIAVLTMALGIGGTTAVFTVVDPLLLAHLPVPNPDELIVVAAQRPDASLFIPFGPPGMRLQPGVTAIELARLRERSRTLADAILDANVADYTMESARPGESQTVRVAMTTSGLFSTLQLQPALGRLFVAGDDAPSAPQVIVISHAMWTGRFGADPGVVGRSLSVTRRDQTRAATIIGVAPRGFTGIEVGVTTDMWLLISPPSSAVAGSPTDPRLGFWRGGRMLARLRQGVDLEDARAELDALYAQLMRDQAAQFASQLTGQQRDGLLQQRLVISDGGRGFSRLRTDYERPLSILLAAVIAVLLIACANVAALLLAQGAARRRELAVCLAIGSGRTRLVRQQLVGSALLACIAGVIGFLAASWITPALLSYAPPLASSSLHFEPNLRVLLFSAAAALTSGMLAGAVPAWRLSRADPSINLKQSAAGATPARRTISRLLIPLQIAVTLVLLIGAGLFVRTFKNLRSIDTGFDTRDVVRVQLAGTFDYSAVVTRLEQVPGVTSAAAWSTGFMSGPGMSMVGPVIPEGTATPGMDEFVPATSVGPRFFETMGIRLLRGRDFTGDDGPNRHPVIVSASMAHRYFGTLDAIGRHFRLSRGPEASVFEIVGVAEDTKYTSLREVASSTMYSPLVLTKARPSNVAVRVSGEPSTAAVAIANALRSFERGLQVTSIRPANDITEEAILRERFLAQVSGAFGALALFLACLGLYGTMAYAVFQRTSEIGIRMALGAQISSVIGMLTREARWTVGVGVTLGLAAAVVTTRVASNLLFGLDATDPVTFSSAVLVLIVAAAAAVWLPARRAARIDPIVALRSE